MSYKHPKAAKAAHLVYVEPKLVPVLKPWYLDPVGKVRPAAERTVWLEAAR